MEMHKRLQGMVIGFILALILSSTVAYASTGVKTLQASYNNIKIVIDGDNITPRDVNGNLVEPFIVSGTTYLPVRAMCEAIGYDVEWDKDTSTVFAYSGGSWYDDYDDDYDDDEYSYYGDDSDNDKYDDDGYEYGYGDKL
jgi:hypothetical protein